MLKNLYRLGISCSVALVAFSSCDNQEFTNENVDVTRVNVSHISDEMAKVRDYVPKFAVIAHRGSTFWVPEETEAAYRWAREMGADYLEADLQCSKDGVVLALHDDNLRRTTNIENVFGEDVPRTRPQFYMRHGMTEKEANDQYIKDRKSFNPYYANQYMYEELAQLDAGTWFNQTSIEQGRTGFSTKQQYISALEDLVMYAKGKKLKRDANGQRVYTVTGNFKDNTIKYAFEYENDNIDRGNRPGIYIEFKESWLNPATFETDVYNVLDRLDYNIITKPEPASNPSYKDGKVNVGNTNGKVIMQTFSLESLRRTADKFQGKIPMCFLLWEGNGATDLKLNTPTGYASFVDLAVQYKAHIIGPSIAGAPNNYPEMNNPWQDYLIKKAGLLNHPYSFDSREQMNKYFGNYNFGVSADQLFNPPYLDGAFTNRSEMTIQFFIDEKVRQYPAPQTVPDPQKLLVELGYEK